MTLILTVNKRRLNGAAVPVGWEIEAAPVGQQEPRKRAGRRARGHKNAEPVVAGPAQVLR